MRVRGVDESKAVYVLVCPAEVGVLDEYVVGKLAPSMYMTGSVWEMGANLRSTVGRRRYLHEDEE